MQRRPREERPGTKNRSFRRRVAGRCGGAWDGAPLLRAPARHQRAPGVDQTQVDARAKEIQRLEKVLQDAGVKLTSVASTVWSKSSRAMVEAMIAGERDSVVLADLAKGKMRQKTDRLEEALKSNFGAHHAILCRQVIDHLDFLDRSIATLSAEICERLVPFEPQVALLTSIPGISATTAQVIVAETGAPAPDRGPRVRRHYRRKGRIDTPLDNFISSSHRPVCLVLRARILFRALAFHRSREMDARGDAVRLGLVLGEGGDELLVLPHSSAPLVPGTTGWTSNPSHS